MAKRVPKEIIDWYRNRLTKIKSEFPDHLPEGFTVEEDILPVLKIITTTYFIIVILDHVRMAEKYPELVKDEGNIVIDFFRRKDFAYIHSVCLYHVGDKGNPPIVSLEGKPIFNDKTLDENNF